MSNMNDAAGLRIPYGKTNSQFDTEFEPATGTIWAYMNQRSTPCFNLGLLKDIRTHDNALAVNSGKLDLDGEQHAVRYYVCGSRAKGVFNLGGDLALFVLLIKSRDREALSHYARMCIDNMHARIQGYYAPDIITISMVQGDALGGGLECALSSDVVIAEKGTQLGLPEILFNLFPGMGAYSLLGRRIGWSAAEKLILSGTMRSAEELYEMGVIDAIAEPASGEIAVRDWIADNRKRRNGTAAVFRARRLVNPVTRQELDSVAEAWVDAALRLQDRDLRMMGRLVRSQMMRLGGSEVVDVGAAAMAEEALAASL